MGAAGRIFLPGQKADLAVARRYGVIPGGDEADGFEGRMFTGVTEKIPACSTSEQLPASYAGEQYCAYPVALDGVGAGYERRAISTGEICAIGIE
jgi:hypothetical protein